MDYYVTKKAGSVMFRQPSKHHIAAGEHIPAEVWEAVPASSKQELLRSGMVQGFEDPDSVKLEDESPAASQPKVGVGKDKFMPHATVQRGERRDEVLDKLIKEQEARKQASDVDPEAGGSPDGVVQIELPPDDDDDDDDDDDELTAEEREMIAELEREQQEGS